MIAQYFVESMEKTLLQKCIEHLKIQTFKTRPRLGFVLVFENLKIP